MQAFDEHALSHCWPENKTMHVPQQQYYIDTVPRALPNTFHECATACGQLNMCVHMQPLDYRE